MRRSSRWRLGIVAAIALTLVALYPQFHLQLVRGKDWNGSYAFFSQDEIAYSAYVNALIEGRPRRNDPYTGRDDAIDSRQPESLFSIQFAPAYAIAIPARVLGLSAPTAFILLTALVAFISTLALFWLLRLVTGDERVAAAGALVVLCLGTFAIVYAPVRSLFGAETTYTFEYFPFLRRYVPALPFPFFFVFCALIWRALSSKTSRGIFQNAVAASFVFAFLVFSYFYLWTAAAAWASSLALVLFIARPSGYKLALKVFAVVFALMGATLLPYFALLANRAATMDSVQLLALSHAPDFSRSSVKFGLIICAALVIAAWRGRVEWKNRALLFAASFALTPLVLFNQQVITGRSLQPLHYELYIAKYLTLVALVITVWLLSRRPFNETVGAGLGPARHSLNESRQGQARSLQISSRLLLSVALVALGWGAFETVVLAGRHEWASVDRDLSLPVAQRLLEMSRAASHHPDTEAVVLYFNLDHADISPVVAPQPVLWAPHTPAFSGVTSDENRERLYQYLYYTNEEMSNTDLEGFDSLPYRKRFLIHSLIEWGHNDSAWTVNWRQITSEEMRAALELYARYAASFSREQATHPTLSYVVTVTDAPPDFKNIDRWYERDSGERVGLFTIYRVRIRE